MDTLSIRLFGDFRAQADQNAAIRFPTRKSKSLLACLALRRRAQRSFLAGELWPEAPEERAQKALNTECWRLRTALRDGGADPDHVLVSDFDSLGLNPAAVWVDASAFEKATFELARMDEGAAADPGLAEGLSAAVQLYSGDLLEGVYEEWCLVHREAYRARLIAALETLVRIRMDEQRWEQAIGFGRRLLEIDPLLEHVHRAMMSCHYQRGHRAAALKQFEACVAVLKRDLNVEPMEDTRGLYDMIIAAAPWAPRLVGEARSLAPLEAVRQGTTAAEKIDFALANLNTARTWLEEANRSLREPPATL